VDVRLMRPEREAGVGGGNGRARRRGDRVGDKNNVMNVRSEFLCCFTLLSTLRKVVGSLKHT